MTEEVKVLDNFLDEVFYSSLNSALVPKHGENNSFPWYWGDKKVNYQSDDSMNFQFVHKFYEEFPEPNKSSYFGLVSPVLQKIPDILCLLRVKANLETYKAESIASEFHWDSSDPDKPHSNVYIGIYYVNTNNGYTELEDGTKVDSVANRMVIFPNTMKHRGVGQTDQKRRCVINFNYIKKEWQTP